MSGFYGIGVYHPKTEENVGTLWRSANLLGASFIFTVGRRYKQQSTDTMKTPLHIPLLHYADIDDLVTHLPHDCPLVGVELSEKAIDLNSFPHPKRACYLLGAEDYGIPPEVLTKCHTQVKLAGKYSMNVAVAGSIVIYHRQVLTKK
jgi:tRNA G18 (ribose-2'-O)-methylase SpoU